MLVVQRPGMSGASVTRADGSYESPEVDARSCKSRKHSEALSHLLQPCPLVLFLFLPYLSYPLYNHETLSMNKEVLLYKQ